MKKITDLKQGDKVYSIGDTRVKWYTYLCVHPMNKKFHILIDDNTNPIKIYEKDLENILALNINTYEEGELLLANKLEELCHFLRRKKIN